MLSSLATTARGLEGSRRLSRVSASLYWATLSATLRPIRGEHCGHVTRSPPIAAHLLTMLASLLSTLHAAVISESEYFQPALYTLLQTLYYENI